MTTAQKGSTSTNSARLDQSERHETPYDPNFPPNLDIRPLRLSKATNNDNGLSEQDEWGQGEAIGQYGIAGRVWYVIYASGTCFSLVLIMSTKLNVV